MAECSDKAFHLRTRARSRSCTAQRLMSNIFLFTVCHGDKLEVMGLKL